LWVGFITFGIRALDSRVSLLQTGHRGIFAITISIRSFRSYKKNPFESKYLWASSPNFTSSLTIFLEIWYEEFRVFASFRIPLQTGHHGIFAILFFPTKVQSLKLKFFWVEILLNLEPEFQIFFLYMFGDTVQDIQSFCKLPNYIPNRWPWENCHKFLSVHQIEIS